MTETNLGEVSLERMDRAVEKVRSRLLRVAAALDQAAVPHAVVVGNAVAAWVARVDESAARNTQDVDLVLRGADLSAAKAALSAAGFHLMPTEPLVTMNLASFRRNDQVHLQDLICVGLIDASWLDRLPTELTPRLKESLDDPEG
ncbi:MAG: hypothetical protein AB7I30_08875 [Isosphaeraceae bacterium]